jgi:hypothetical protein
MPADPELSSKKDGPRNEAAERMRNALEPHEVLLAELLDAALAEERRLALREVRERFAADAPTAMTSTLVVRRILDEVEADHD